MQNNLIWARALTDRDFSLDASHLARRLEEFKNRLPTVHRTSVENEPGQAPWPDACLIPEVPTTEFNAQLLKSAMASSGSLIVRGFLDRASCRFYKSVIDEVLSSCSQRPRPSEDNATEMHAFYNPPANLNELMSAQKWTNSRGFHRNSGSAMCIESSSVAEQLMELYEEKGLRSIIGDYLGGQPCLSALKWVLRRSLLPVSPAGWHQDGAFMGSDINSINMWIPLDQCGGDSGAPGMDVLPKRLKEIVNTGTDDAVFSWSPSTGEITESFGEKSIVSPVFEPGDAFFFDQFFLHRTQYKASFSRLRYAIETWFFDSENFPKNQIPLSW